MSADTPSTVLLDTHVLLWWQAESAHLSKKARKLIEEASNRLVSPVSFWEIAMLIEKGRVELDRPTAVWVNDFLSTDRVAVAELTSAIAVAAGEISAFHGDPADRMIVASAMAVAVPLVTKDKKIRDWARTWKGISAVW